MKETVKTLDGRMFKTLESAFMEGGIWLDLYNQTSHKDVGCSILAAPYLRGLHLILEIYEDTIQS